MPRIVVFVCVLVHGLASRVVMSDPAITIRPAKSHEAQVVLDLVEKNRPEIRTEDQGFLLTAIQTEELEAYIASETVLLAQIEAKPAGFVIALDTYAYEGLEGADLTWHSACAAKLYEDAHFFYLWLIGVDPDFHGLGVGKKLLEAVESIARKKGKNCITADYMTAPQINRRSSEFFKRRGFETSGTLRLADYHGVGPSTYQIISLACSSHES